MAKKAEKGLDKYGKMKPTNELTVRVLDLENFDPYEDAPGYPNVDYWIFEYSFKNQPNVHIKVRPNEFLETYNLKDNYISIKLMNIWSVHKISKKTLTLEKFRKKYEDIFIDPRSAQK